MFYVFSCSGAVSETERRELLVIVINTRDVQFSVFLSVSDLCDCSGDASEFERRELLVIVINTQDVQFKFLDLLGWCFRN